MKEYTWIQTDPDQEQYGMKIGKHTYMFKDRLTKKTTIDISELNDMYIAILVATYGYGYKGGYRLILGKKNIDLEESKWLIAECEFEQSYSKIYGN